MTFQEFKKSFSYRSRSDLNFKFLAGLSDDAAADFFQGLLKHTITSIDSGNYDSIKQHVIEGQTKSYSGTGGRFIYNDSPFAKLVKPLNQVNLGLLTSTGHFVDGDDPEPFGMSDMTQSEAENRIDDFLRDAPTLSHIPFDTPKEKIKVRHGGYDISAANEDMNVAFPLELLLELKEQGVIGSLTEDAYSFVGATAQTRLLNKDGKEWVALFKEMSVDAVLLVPV